jgi:hypothetical protein
VLPVLSRTWQVLEAVNVVLADSGIAVVIGMVRVMQARSALPVHARMHAVRNIL